MYYRMVTIIVVLMIPITGLDLRKMQVIESVMDRENLLQTGWKTTAQSQCTGGTLNSILELDIKNVVLLKHGKSDTFEPELMRISLDEDMREKATIWLEDHSEKCI